MQNNQLQAKQQQQEAAQNFQYSTKDSSQNRNIEQFLNRSNKYSKESLQFLQEKNTLLLQQQQLAQQNKSGHAKWSHRGDNLNQEVNKIYEIRTQFNKFEQENRNSQNINLVDHHNQFLISRDDQLVENNNNATEDLDEVQENEQYTVSSKMRTLQSSSKQTFSISKVELKNIIPLDQRQNGSVKPASTQDLNSGEKKSVNTYVLSPNISARTLQPNQLGSHIQIQQQQIQIQQINNQFQSQQNIQDQQFQQTNIFHNNQKKLLQDNNSPSFFNQPEVSDQNSSSLKKDRIGIFGHNSMTNLKSGPNSAMSTQRTLKGTTFGTNSTANLNAGLSPNNPGISVNQSVQNLGYAINLVNKNLEDLSRHIAQMNPNNLQILDLSSNRFSVFPIDVCKMKNLKRLKLENNLIKFLPKELFQELRLESFSVQNNLIQDIPPEICEWKGCLQCLNISRNHINTFQKYFCYLDGLTSLNISSNDFMEIPIELIFLVNLKEFSIDWFKYCLPSRKSTVQGLEGQSIIKEIFMLLCLHRNQGFVTFLQFTTHFSDKNLIKISSQIKKSKGKYVQQMKDISPNKKNNRENQQNGGKLNSIKENSRNKQGNQEQQNDLLNQENRFILNVSNTNLLNSTTTSFNDSILPKESEGIQLLPEELKKKKNRLLCVNRKNTKEEESLIENSRSMIDLNNLKVISQNSQMQNQQPLSSKRTQRSNSNLQLNHQILQTSGACKTLINFSSDSDISFRNDEVLHTHNDLSFFQENQQKSIVNTPSAHPLRGKKNSKSQSTLQIVKNDENVNFDKVLQEVEEENEEKNNQLILQQLNLQLESPPDQLLSSREQKFLQNQFGNNKQQENDMDDQDEGDENILSDSKEEQEQKPQSAQCLDMTTPKIYTQYNQIDPKNGRNLLHLFTIKEQIANYLYQLITFLIEQAIMDEDISALRCLVNLNFDLINDIDYDGQTPLSLSILEEKYYSAKILIFNKGDTNIGGGVFGSCLTIGIIKMQYYLIRDLIRFGADVNKQDNDGNGPLHYLFQQFYRNPIESAKIAQMLLDNGANPNLENNDKWCPLHFAVKRGCLEAVELAFQHNRVCLAKKNKRGFMINKAGGQERITILHIASELNHQRIVQLLLKNNADIFARKSDNKLAYQLCQKHTLVKKLLLLQQTRQVDQHLITMESASIKQENENISNGIDDQNKQSFGKDSSFEIYKKKSSGKKQKSKKRSKKQSSQKQNNQDDFNMIQTQKQQENQDDEDEEQVVILNDIDDDDEEDEDMQADSDDNFEDDEDVEEDEDKLDDEKDENLIDSADSFPVDMEDENRNPSPVKINKNTISSTSNNSQQKNKLNHINISSQPRMIKNGEVHKSKIGQFQFPKFNNQFEQFQNNKNLFSGNTKELIEHHLNESKQSLDEIEDEDLKGDVPKWFYKDHSQIPYSPNNLQKIQGMNEIISQIIQQNTAINKTNNQVQNQSSFAASNHKVPDIQFGKILLQNTQIDEQKKNLLLKNSNPLTQQYLIQQQLQQQAAKTQTIQACNFFSNLKNYKQVIKSASNINEHQLKILEEGLSLTTRLYFLTQLKLIQFKLIQILSLITRQNIYQLFCRSGIIEDFLKLGDDNLNTLINTSQEFNRSIVLIYKRLSDSPSFDNNSLLIQIVNLFGDTCHSLIAMFYDKQVNDIQLSKHQSPITSQTTLVNQQFELQMAATLNENISSNSLTQKDTADTKNNAQEGKKNEKDEPPIQTFAQRMKINYSNNILKDFLELQQCLKIKRDNFTQRTLITDQDFDRIMPTEEEYETDNEELTKVLSNYAHIKLRNNPLQEVPKQNKVFK